MLIKQTVFMCTLIYYLHPSNGILTSRTSNFGDLSFGHSGHSSNVNKCTSRLHGSLEKMRKRQANLKSAGFIDLSGYALHQTLRHLPLDMYITDIRVRTPEIGNWVRIEKCQFSNRDNRVTTQILFNDLTVSGTVQLLDDNETRKNLLLAVPREFCKMSMRFQKAGLGINAFPAKGRNQGLDVKTEARFLDPKFLSVHAYGCKLNDIFRRDVTERSQAPSHTMLEGVRFRNHFDFQVNQNATDHNKSPLIETLARSASDEEQQPDVRIITLNPEIKTSEDFSEWFNLHDEEEAKLNDFHRNRVLRTKLHATTEREKLKAILHVQKLIAQQANHMFQTQGPLSQIKTPLFKPYKKTNTKSKPHNSPSVISTITELDENLSPIRPVSQRPYEALYPQDQSLSNPSNPDFQNYYEIISREMEDIFLRGIKTLLTKYVEKQLKVPLKEALMVNFGYTVSYGK